MKMCPNHWEALRQAIKDRGLWHLVSQGPDAVKETIERELRGEPTTAATYDPLFAANTMISGEALKLGGLYLMTGDYCPLCEVEKHTGDTAANWINGCTDAVLTYCQQRGFTNPAQ